MRTPIRPSAMQLRQPLLAAKSQLRAVNQTRSKVTLRSVFPRPDHTEYGPNACPLTLLQDVQRVVAVIDKVNAVVTGSNRQAEQSACPIARVTHIHKTGSHLPAARSGFHHQTVAAVDRENVAIGRYGEAQWLVQRTAL